MCYLVMHVRPLEFCISHAGCPSGVGHTDAWAVYATGMLQIQCTGALIAAC